MRTTSLGLLATLMISSTSEAKIFDSLEAEQPVALKRNNYIHLQTKQDQDMTSFPPLERKNASYNLKALYGQECIEALQEINKAIYRTSVATDPITLGEEKGINPNLPNRRKELRKALNISNLQDFPKAVQVKNKNEYYRILVNMAVQQGDFKYGNDVDERKPHQYFVITDRLDIFREVINNTNDKPEATVRLKAFYNFADILERNPSAEEGKAGVLASFYAYYNIVNTSRYSDYTKPAVNGMMRTLERIIEGGQAENTVSATAAPTAVPLALQIRAVKLAFEYDSYFKHEIDNAPRFAAAVIDRNKRVSPAAQKVARSKGTKMMLNRPRHRRGG